jgi:hypothetical protein
LQKLERWQKTFKQSFPSCGESFHVRSQVPAKSTQATSTSASPEILDALDHLLGRIAAWDTAATTSMDTHAQARLLREDYALGETLQNLPLFLETK